MATASTVDRVRSGIDTATLYGTLDLLGQHPDLGRVVVRAHNAWVDGEPQLLLGADGGTGPAEELLHALAACLTTSLVYVAAAREVRLTRVESWLEGEMDLPGALGAGPEPRNGFDHIRVRFAVEGDAPREELEEVVQRAQARSAVFDMVSYGVPVTVEVAAA